MNHQISNVFSRLILVFAMASITGCSNVSEPIQGPLAGRTDGKESLSEKYGTGESDALRVKTDMARGRTWVLDVNQVRVYDVETKKLIRQIALPSWSVVKAVCDPDLILDRSGSALVSSNVQAKLWRIDGDSFEAKAQEIRLPGKEDWEVGFGALAFTSGGALYALSSSTHHLWKIDAATYTASMIERYYPPMNACTLTPQFLSSIERSRKSWISQSPQQN